MMDGMTIRAPAEYVPLAAVACGQDGDAVAVVRDAHPMPVRIVGGPARSTPLAGSATAATVAGPFAPDAERPVWITLTGTWTGSVRLLRSVDAGATQHPLTAGGEPWGVFTGNVNEPVIVENEAAARYYLSIAITAGTLGYRVAQ